MKLEIISQGTVGMRYHENGAEGLKQVPERLDVLQDRVNAFIKNDNISIKNINTVIIDDLARSFVYYEEYAEDDGGDDVI